MNTDSNKLEVLIRTDSLKKILNEEPEVRLKLQSMACEKIAEELKRKVSQMSLEQLQGKLQATVDAAVTEANKNLSSKYKFPPEAKAIIKDLAKEKVEAYFKAEIRRWENSINEFFAAKQVESDRLTEEKVMATIEKMRPAIKQQAREEFFAVLEQAQQVKQ